MYAYRKFNLVETVLFSLSKKYEKRVRKVRREKSYFFRGQKSTIAVKYRLANKKHRPDPRALFKPPLTHFCGTIATLFIS